MSKRKTRKVHRDAGTGRFVTEEYARNNPGTTVTETVEIKQRKRKRKK
jgi:hypothetical protein